METQLLGRTVMINLGSILKSRNITLPTKVSLVKAIIFPVVMYGCERWTVKKAECQNIDAFELWCWRLLRVPWTARRSNQSILKEISPEYLLERLKVGGEGHDRGWDGWMASPPQWTWVWVNSGSWWWEGKPGALQPMGLQSQTWLSEWTELNWQKYKRSQIARTILRKNRAVRFKFPTYGYTTMLQQPKLYGTGTKANRKINRAS